MDKHYALAREAILAALTAYTGITTEDGAGDGSTLVDANLIGENDFISNKTILIGSGDGDKEDSGASSFDNTTGTITVVSPFSAQIKAGTIYRILNISTVEIDVSTINTKIGTNTDAAGTTTVFARLRQIVDDYLADGTIGLAALQTLIEAGDVDVAAIEAKLDKLAGEAVVNGTESKNWNTAEQDLVSLGAATTKYKLHSLIVDISQLTATATINIRLYIKVNGVERKVYDQTFVVGTDPDGCWIVNGTIGIHDVLRVTCQSDNVADDGKAIAYTAMLEAM